MLTLFDDQARTQLLPFTHTRPAADMRCGIMTMRERWERLLGEHQSFTITADYLQPVFSAPADEGNHVLVNGRVVATPELAGAIKELSEGEHLLAADGTLLAIKLSGTAPGDFAPALAQSQAKSWTSPLMIINRPWDLFSLNDAVLRLDFRLITDGRSSAVLPPHVTVAGQDIFVEEGAVIQPGVILNATTGPIYIGKGAEVMEGCIVRGPFALCESAVLKMAAKIYPATSIGPGCKVGGEVGNVVFFANSNKGHDGYLGNAVIGEWCNLGADTNASNLKNNYDAVKVWDEASMKSIATGLTFCGLLMGDHSKCGINTMFNTGTVAGVSCNIWGGGFPEKFLPSFSWGGPEGMSTYEFPRAMETAERMMARRGKILSDAERGMLQHVYESTAASRQLIFGQS